MKKILKMLVLGLLSAALLCCALPSAFAAEQKDAQIYTIGLDAMGGTSSVVAVTTNLNGKLSALPAQPTLDGYTFDGWYTRTVGGTKVTTICTAPTRAPPIPPAQAPPSPLSPSRRNRMTA